MYEWNLDLFLRLRSANRYCCHGQSTLPGGSSGLVRPRFFHGRVASCHPLTCSGGSSQTSASAFATACAKRLGPPSSIHASCSSVLARAASVSKRGRCRQPVLSLIASKETTGTSGRTKANRLAKWLFPTPFAPVMMIFFNHAPVSCRFQTHSNGGCFDSQRQLSRSRPFVVRIAERRWSAVARFAIFCSSMLLFDQAGTHAHLFQVGLSDTRRIPRCAGGVPTAHPPRAGSRTRYDIAAICSPPTKKAGQRSESMLPADPA